MFKSKHKKAIEEIEALFAGFPTGEFADDAPVAQKVGRALARLSEGRRMRKGVSADLARMTLERDALKAELAPLKDARDKRLANLAGANARRKQEAEQRNGATVQ